MLTGSENIIERMEAGYTEILDLCQNVPSTALVEPAFSNGRSPKDTLAHIAAWVWRCAALLEAAHSSDGPLKAEPDVEGLNHAFYQERQAWRWADVEADFRQAHSALFKAIRQLPPERLGEALVQETISGATWEHYAEYGPDLKRWYSRFVAETISPVR